MSKKNKGSNNGALGLAVGIGALLGAAATIGAALIFGDDKEEAKEQTKQPVPPPLTQPQNVPTDIEERLLCPISLEIMQDPVVTPYGHTYDRKNIEEYIDRYGIDPITRLPLKKESLAPNYTVREMLEHFDQTRREKIKNES